MLEQLKKAMKTAMKTKKDIVLLSSSNFSYNENNQNNILIKTKIPASTAFQFNNTQTLIRTHYLPQLENIRDYLNTLNKTLQFPSKNKKRKESLINDEFSPDLLKYIYGSSKCVFEEEYYTYLFQFVKSYLEFFALQTIISKKECPLLHLMNKYKFKNNIIYSFNEWSIDEYASPKTHSLIELIGKVCNCNQNEATTIVATLLNISFRNFYNFTNELHSADYNANNNISLTCIPTQIRDVTLYDTKQIKGFAEQQIGFICTYNYNGYLINIMASISKGILAFGTVAPTAYFINHTVIDSKPEATVLLFQNYNQARAFEKYQEQCIISPQDIIITSHISNDINILPWTLLTNRKVVLILETIKDSFNMLPQYKKWLDSYNVNYSIYPYPLIFNELSDISANSNLNIEQCSFLEKDLLEHAIVVDNYNKPKEVVKIILNNTFSYEEFLIWSNKFNKTKNSILEATTQKNSSDFRLENFFFQPNQSEQVILTDYNQIPSAMFFGKENITLMHARKDTGKSLAALEIAKALALNLECFNFIKNSSKLNVMYIDGETNGDTLNQRFKQLRLENSISLISLKCLPDSIDFNKFNLSNKESRDFLENYILVDYDFLVLDNITCLVGDSNISNGSIAQEIMNWCTELSKKVSILIIHHTNEEKDKVSGSDIWKRRCTNELQLFGKKDLDSFQDLPEELKQIAKDFNGAFFGIKCNSSKSYSVLKDKIIWVGLLLGATNWNLYAITNETGKILKDIHQNKIEENLSLNQNNTQSISQQLNCDEQKVLNLVDETFKREDVDKILKCSETKSQQIIKQLLFKRVIIKDGKSKATLYKKV